MFGNSRLERKVSRMDRRLARMERKLDAVLDHLGLDVPEPEEGFEEVAELLRQDKKIQAIKVYRERTGADLVEAKNEVERLADRI